MMGLGMNDTEHTNIYIYIYIIYVGKMQSLEIFRSFFEEFDGGGWVLHKFWGEVLKKKVQLHVKNGMRH